MELLLPGTEPCKKESRNPTYKVSRSLDEYGKSSAPRRGVEAERAIVVVFVVFVVFVVVVELLGEDLLVR